MTALHAEAVPAEIVMPTGRADQPPRRIRLQPSLVLSPVPDPILGSEHPAPALVVEHREIAYGDPERTRLQVADAPFFDQELVATLCFGEWIYRHRSESMAAWPC